MNSPQHNSVTFLQTEEKSIEISKERYIPSEKKTVSYYWNNIYIKVI